MEHPVHYCIFDLYIKCCLYDAVHCVHVDHTKIKDKIALSSKTFKRIGIMNSKISLSTYI